MTDNNTTDTPNTEMYWDEACSIVEDVCNSTTATSPFEFADYIHSALSDHFDDNDITQAMIGTGMAHTCSEVELVYGRQLFLEGLKKELPELSKSEVLRVFLDFTDGLDLSLSKSLRERLSDITHTVRDFRLPNGEPFEGTMFRHAENYVELYMMYERTEAIFTGTVCRGLYEAAINVKKPTHTNVPHLTLVN